jgi:hypothetical protein
MMSLREKNDIISIPNQSQAEIFKKFPVFPYLAMLYVVS